MCGKSFGCPKVRSMSPTSRVSCKELKGCVVRMEELHCIHHSLNISVRSLMEAECIAIQKLTHLIVVCRFYEMN